MGFCACFFFFFFLLLLLLLFLFLFLLLLLFLLVLLVLLDLMLFLFFFGGGGFGVFMVWENILYKNIFDIANILVLQNKEITISKNSFVFVQILLCVCTLHQLTNRLQLP